MGVTVKEEIPICHMLTVAAACLEREHANPKLSEDLPAAAKEEAKKFTEGRDCGQPGKCHSRCRLVVVAEGFISITQEG
jgi:hypothetical protein